LIPAPHIASQHCLKIAGRHRPQWFAVLANPSPTLPEHCLHRRQPIFLDARPVVRASPSLAFAGLAAITGRVRFADAPQSGQRGSVTIPGFD
jgi:hypothetical protein